MWVAARPSARCSRRPIEARETPGVRVTLITPGSVNTPAYSQAAN
jgi:hypothetical protein